MNEEDYVETFVMAFLIGLVSAVIMTAMILFKDEPSSKCVATDEARQVASYVSPANGASPNTGLACLRKENVIIAFTKAH